MSPSDSFIPNTSGLGAIVANGAVSSDTSAGKSSTGPFEKLGADVDVITGGNKIGKQTGAVAGKVNEQFQAKAPLTFRPVGNNIDQITGLGVNAGVNPEGI